MMRGTKVMLICFVMALFVFLINVVMIDDFLYNFTSQTAVDPSSGFYSGGLISKFAQVQTFMPILLVILGIGYNVFDRVFGQESQDWLQ